jgi:hypothetical protein
MSGLLAAQQLQLEQFALELRKLLRTYLDSMLNKGDVGNLSQVSLAIEEQGKGVLGLAQFKADIITGIVEVIAPSDRVFWRRRHNQVIPKAGMNLGA